MDNCPGYLSPQEAIKSEKEKIIYVTCVSANWKLSQNPDFLAVIDVDPTSSTYSQVIHRLDVPYIGDELHHTGWNACSSCKNSSIKRNRFIMPGLNSDRIYIVDTTKQHAPVLFKIIEPSEVHIKGKAGAPHTVHCLPNGDIMLSCMGDAEGNAKGTFILLEQETFSIKGIWERDCRSANFNYDFWYQPRHNIMVSTEWAAPKTFRKGFSVQDVKDGLYGHSITFWNWSERKAIKTLDLGSDGHIPLEVRFLHNPDADVGYVGCALSSTVFKISKRPNGDWDADKVITVPQKRVKNWFLPEMPGLITDILISMDDRFLYISNWIQGDVRQYDISATTPKLVGQIFLGGSMCTDSKVTTLDDSDTQPERPSIKSVPLRGGPQMLQLSLDGKRLYVTTSLFSAWDTQFYPHNISDGCMMVLINVNITTGGLTLDPEFLIDFGNIEGGPVLAHEMRFPTGDCTSDIWV